MLTAVRLSWDTVDDGQWLLLRTSLSTEQLAPYGCLSSHLRRSGTVLRVNALWGDQHGAQIFCEGRLRTLVATAGLEPPEASRVSLPGLYAIGRRSVPEPDSARCAEPDAAPSHEARWPSSRWHVGLTGAAPTVARAPGARTRQRSG